MLTSDERLQIEKFQSAIAAMVDAYLKEGLYPDTISEILREEASSDLVARLAELEAS